MVSDFVLFVISVLGLTFTTVSILYTAGYFRRHNTKQDHEDENHLVNGRDRGLVGLGRRNNRRRQIQNENLNQAPQIAREEVDENNQVHDENIQLQGQTTRQLLKELRRRKREELRRLDQLHRENQQQFESEYDMKRREEQMQEEEEEERLARAIAEKKLKEQQEFNSWKGTFSVQKEGSKYDVETKESNDLLEEFVTYLKLQKVVLLEDVAAKFQLSTQETINRVEKLQADGQLTGIIDDRGKFVYISNEEMDKIARWIQRKGRVSLQDLVKECNRLI